MTEPVLTDPGRKRLLYRAMHRGFKEADIVIGSFAKEHLPTMTDAQVTEFEALLEASDTDLYNWIIGREETPAGYQGEVMTMLQAFPIAETLARNLRDGESVG